MPGPPTQIVKFTYVNHRGEKAERRVLPIRVWFGRTDYHPDEQWFLHAFDVGKLAPRDFAMVDIIGWRSDAKELDDGSRRAIGGEPACERCGCTFAAHFHFDGPCSNCKNCLGYKPLSPVAAQCGVTLGSKLCTQPRGHESLGSTPYHRAADGTTWADWMMGDVRCKHCQATMPPATLWIPGANVATASRVCSRNVDAKGNHGICSPEKP